MLEHRWHGALIRCPAGIIITGPPLGGACRRRAAGMECAWWKHGVYRGFYSCVVAFVFFFSLVKVSETPAAPGGTAIPGPR